MICKRCWLLVLAGCFSYYSVALGSTRVEVSVGGGAYQEPGIQVTPGVIHVGNPMDCPDGPCSQTKVSASSDLLEVVTGGGASFQTSLATASASARAEIGSLGIFVQAGGSGGQNMAKGEASASAAAEWRYVAPFLSNSVASGAMVTVRSVLILEGTMNGSASGENASMFGSFRIEDLSGVAGFPAAPYDGGIWGSIHALGGAPEVQPIPGAIRITRQFRNGAFNPIGFRFSLFSQATSDTIVNSTIDAKAGTAVVTADASHSLRWGGIESVVDEFGNPVTDWTLIGENGFDFSKPFPIPEPAGAVTVLVALSLTGSRRVRRRLAGNA